MTDQTITTATETKAAEGVTLDTPIKRGDQTITRVQVRKPNAGALRGLSLVEVLQIPPPFSCIPVTVPRLSSSLLLGSLMGAMRSSM